MRLILVVFMVGTGFFSQAQDLTGIWRGLFKSNSQMMPYMNMENRYKFEVQIDQRGKTFKGVTYSYKTTEFYGKATAKGTLHTGTKKVVLEEVKIVEVRMRSGSNACIMTCFLQYSRNGNEEFLEGSYVSMNTKDSTDCGRGTVFLRKVAKSDFFEEPFLAKRQKDKKNPEATKIKPMQPEVVAQNKPVPKPVKPPAPPAKKVAPPKPAPAKPVESKLPQQGKAVEAQNELHKPEVPAIIPPVLKNRENELIRTFTVNTKDITVSLYDNGTIDKDTVSVYLNKKLVISKQMLSLSPITLNITLDDDREYQELVMVAENLGEIPPNTSLMVVKAGKQQFEVRITSTEQKNAVVLFRYEAPNP